MSAVQHGLAATATNPLHVRIGRMGRNKGLRLRGNGSENTLLVEPQAVSAPPVRRRLESRTPNLW